MGIYLNPGKMSFLQATKNPIYVDKSLLIEYTNSLMGINDCKICVSRPRRFGKSTDANMLVAYYSKGCDSLDIFNDLKISQTELYQKHINKHNVIHIDVQKFLSNSEDIDKMIKLLTQRIINEIKKEYDVELFDETSLSMSFEDIFAKTGEQFVFIIDEWDCIFREYKEDKEAQEKYLDYLRLLFKEQPYVELVYMTGILPIKKYGTHSALNMFDEISMVDPGLLPEFMGLTEKEVENLCIKYDVSFEMMKQWYDGYRLTKEISVFSPRSVVASITRKKFDNYWTNTETYEALRVYIDMNYDGLKDEVVKLLAGEDVRINTDKFQNDMTTFKSKDDVLTLLIHLGYLGYNRENQKCYIPNKEVTSAFINSIEDSNWKETTRALLNSQELLEATWQKDEEAVAKYLEEAHLDTAILTYNNENALSYTISIAYMAARNHYTIIREMPGGKGYADMVFIPKEDKPALIVELKWDQEVETAIDQIKEKKYYFGLEKYLDNLLLIGISYNKETKKHSCKIEKYRQ
ncbi:MAG: AAA family ATPase [Thomasclavelia sp.]